MKNLYKKWDSFWFLKGSAADLGIGRALFFLTVFFLSFNKDYGRFTFAASQLWSPVSVHLFLGLSPPSFRLLQILSIIFKISLLLSCLGFLTRISIFVCTVTAFYLFSLHYSFYFTFRHDGVVVIAMMILALSKSGDRWSIDSLFKKSSGDLETEEYGWTLRTLQVLWCIVFFASAVNKIHYNGLSWGNEGLHYALKMKLLSVYSLQNAFIGTSLAQTLYDNKFLCSLLSYGAHFSELLMPLALLGKRFSRVLVPLGFLMLLAIKLLFNLDFLFYWGAVGVFWIPWGRLYEKSFHGKGKG